LRLKQGKYEQREKKEKKKKGERGKGKKEKKNGVKREIITRMSRSVYMRRKCDIAIKDIKVQKS